MDYKKAYYSLIERLKEAKEDADVCDERYCCVIDGLIQEQEECEDNRIREAILEHIQLCTESIPDRDKFIAWLEKQGTPAKLSKEEQNRFAKGVLSSCALSFINYLEAHKKEGKMCVSNGECEEIENAFQNTMWDRLHRYYCKYIERQGNKPQGKSALEAAKEEKVDNGDKIEVKPKFKIGDWVVNKFGDSWHIDSYDKKNYQVSNGRKYNFFSIFKQNEMHLWSIQDAKDGDVLVFDNNVCTMGTIICKSPTSYDTKSYCRLIDEHFIGKEENGWDSMLLVPATKEQKDFLFKRMEEEGYKWDDEHKELKKVETIDIPFSAKDSELIETTYFIPEGFHAEIEDNKVIIKKGEQKLTTEMITPEKSLGIDSDTYNEIVDECIYGEKKPAWSEEDDVKLNDTINLIEQSGNVRNIREHYISWLQSLKQRVIWKPTVNEKSNTELAEPAPITPKILQKNGFKLKPDGWIWCQDNGNKEQNYIFIQFRKDLDEVRLVEISFVGKIQATFRQINDVHELQSLLNICHIKKEIEL